MHMQLTRRLSTCASATTQQPVISDIIITVKINAIYRDHCHHQQAPRRDGWCGQFIIMTAGHNWGYTARETFK